MAPLISLQSVSKQFGTKSLFSNLSYTISPGDRIGIIGPNGSGKSSLLKILQGEEDVDDGTISKSKDLTVCYVSQNFLLDAGQSAEDLIESSANPFQVRAGLDLLGLQITSEKLSQLSGGQRKKLQLALSFAEETDLLLLDEPSNHLDLNSIIELEKILDRRHQAIVMISHDRWLLETFSERIIEINPTLSDGYFYSDDSYLEFLAQKTLYLEAEQKNFESLKNKVRQEQAWLRQGAKARSTKSKHRTASAENLISLLGETKSRRQANSLTMEFVGSGRGTKDLVEFENVSKSFGDRPILDNLSFKLQRGSRFGLMGSNGSGKSTILRLITGDLKEDRGVIKKANNLKITYFSQFSDAVDPDLPLKSVLNPDGDAVVFQGRSIHIASWAKRFGFDPKSLHQPYGSLSGGERAKVRISTLMLEQPDVLLLDEPTNDLDISTLEVLEESLLEFTGAIILVTHDRYMLNKVCSTFIGIQEGGHFVHCSSYEQWMNANEMLVDTKSSSTPQADSKSKNAADKKSGKLTFNEQQEYNKMSRTIEEAEKKVQDLEVKILQFEGDELLRKCEELGHAQKKVELLYKRWEDLEERVKSLKN